MIKKIKTQISNFLFAYRHAQELYFALKFYMGCRNSFKEWGEPSFKFPELSKIQEEALENAFEILSKYKHLEENNPFFFQPEEKKADHLDLY